MKAYIYSLCMEGAYEDKVIAKVIIPRPSKEDYSNVKEWEKKLKEWKNLRLGKIDLRLEDEGKVSSKDVSTKDREG